MTSISMPAALPAAFNTSFDSIPDILSPSSTPTHLRRHSRNPNAPPLPAFSFNPSQLSVDPPEQEPEKSTIAPDPMPSPERPRRAPRPPRLPDFKFNPGADIVGDSEPSPTHPILEEMALNQHRNSRSAKSAPLPAFNFTNTGSVSQPSPSPTRTSFGDAAGSLRAAGGHRRRPSEFVGGGADGSQIISTSPQKPDARPQAASLSSFPPRGHAHRRSQAVSISEIDTSDLIKANAVSKHRTGSTPSTPSDSTRTQFFTHTSPQERQSISYPAKSLPASPRRRGSAPGARPRVGFADHVDVIPRPLSLISSETEGSTSTIRGCHSVSGSINSIAASPIPRFPLPARTNSDEEISKARPQTADANLVFNRLSAIDDTLGAVTLPKRPLSASDSPVMVSNGSPPTKKKHFWFSHSNETSPSPTPKLERTDPLCGSPALTSDEASASVRPKTSPERSTSLKGRKVRSWTHGIFSRKARHRPIKGKGKRTPTPPLLIRRASDSLNEIFDADDTIVIRDGSPVSKPSLVSVVPPMASSLLTTRDLEPGENVISPVIDLDAALGPFGSEERFHSETASRSGASKMAKLHSSERRGIIDAFGSVHRRAESAPQMPAMNSGSYSLHRLGSNISLTEDVFDEEEEDNFLACEQEAVRNSSESFHAPTEEEEQQVVVASEIEKASPAKSARNNPRSVSIDGLGLSLSQPGDAVIIVDAEDVIGFDATRASDSTIEAPILPDDVSKQPASSPMDLAYHVPQSHYASSTEGRTTSNSLISSPDADHISFDTQPRFSRHTSEASPETGLRVSTDDLPSLTDSISTGNVPRCSSSANTRSSVEHRSTSIPGISVSKSGPAWKRASLASLNRFIPGSAHGSRLKFEATPDPIEDEKTKKKINRLSKLINFWRSKERAEINS